MVERGVCLDDVRRVCCEPVKASMIAQVGGSKQTGRIPPCCSEVTSVGGEKKESKTARTDARPRKKTRRLHRGLHLHAVEQRRKEEDVK